MNIGEFGVGRVGERPDRAFALVDQAFEHGGLPGPAHAALEGVHLLPAAFDGFVAHFFRKLEFVGDLVIEIARAGDPAPLLQRLEKWKHELSLRG